MKRSVSLAEIEVAYRAHGHHVLRRATLLLGSESDAREVLQEVFLSLVANPEQFSATSALSTWLYSATTHRCLNRLRDERNRARILVERSEAWHLSGAVASPEHVAVLRELLIRLPLEIAHVAVYQLADEMSQDEIAEAMGCSRRQVRKLLEQLESALAAQRVIA